MSRGVYMRVGKKKKQGFIDTCRVKSRDILLEGGEKSRES